MNKAIQSAGLVAALFLASAVALAKLPPPPPMDPAAKEAADAKKKAAAEKAKVELAAAEERTVKNYQENMRNSSKPVSRPMPVTAQSKRAGDIARVSHKAKADATAKTHSTEGRK